MIELPLIFVGGLLGSAHCIGMCGPLAIALSSAGPERLLRRQLVFSLGRLFTYASCGAMAGFGGAWISASSRTFVLSQAWLALLAGVVLVLMGLATAGLLPRPALQFFGAASCGAAGWMKTFLNSPSWTGVLLAGVFTGFIPCGLVYAFLLKAGSSGGIWQGWLTMAAFGLGTVPLMVAVGYGGRLFSVAGRARLFRIAAWCIVLTGAISIARGASQLNTPVDEAAEACPFCASDVESP
ncbi:MAG: sulfite exporter TauE/SafE family protein [Planctomycetales bacterium]|nr:sulfite exporter TauE/SafE family protein [Planctomycetales bacterium]